MRETTSRARQAQRHLRILKTRDAEISRLRSLLARAMELLVMTTDLLPGLALTPELRHDTDKLGRAAEAYAKKQMGL